MASGRYGVYWELTKSTRNRARLGESADMSEGISSVTDSQAELLESPPAGRKRFLSVADALEDARGRAAEMDLPKPLVDFLYSRTRFNSISRAEWEWNVRVATALNDNFTRFGSQPLLREIAHRIDSSTKRALMRDLQSAATLVVGFHGGFGNTRRKLFARMFPDGIIIGATGKHTASDGAHALFAARERLLDGGLVLIAPDGRFGKESGTISVLGAQLPITDGAPFLAHTSGCAVTWLALVRTGERFTLETVSGPQAEKGERFAAYKERFYRFYTDRLEEAFTADPANLPLIINWKLTFGAMLAGKVYRYRRPTR